MSGLRVDTSQIKPNGQNITGWQYVNDWLEETQTEMDFEWIAECIDRGYFLICPQCRFLHFPQIAWWLGIGDGDNRSDGCDVCAHVGAMSVTDLDPDCAMLPEDIKSGWQQSPELRRARSERALLLYQLWWSAHAASRVWSAAAVKGAWLDIRGAAGRPPDKAAVSTILSL